MLVVPVLTILITPLAAQQESRARSVTTIDLNGRPQISYSSSEVRSESGSNVVETSRSPNGREVRRESVEERVLRDDASGRVVERIIHRYDADGRPGPPEKIRIEEKLDADGSRHTESSVYRADLSGRLELSERTRSSASASGAVETALERPTLNGGMEVVEREKTVKRESSGTTESETIVYRKNANGGFSEAVRVRTVATKSGDAETSEQTRWEPDPSGRFVVSGKTVRRTVKNPDGSQTEETDVYSLFSVGRTADANADQPRLQEQIRKLRRPGDGKTSVETTSVRARLPNDPSRFSDYAVVSTVTVSEMDSSGRAVESSQSAVRRRDINGGFSLQEVRREEISKVKK